MTIRRALRQNLPAVGVLAVVVLAGLVSWFLLDAEAWGAFGQWAGAFGSVLAVVVALHIAGGEVARAAQRQHEEQAANELRQARLVVTTIEGMSGEEEYLFTQQFGGEPPTLVRIANRSARPVLYPRIEGFEPIHGSTVRWDIETDVGGGYDKAPTIVDPGDTDTVPVRVWCEPTLPQTEFPLRLVPIIGFTDADGQRWRRAGTGTPQRVVDGEPSSGQGPDWYRVEG